MICSATVRWRGRSPQGNGNPVANPCGGYPGFHFPSCPTAAGRAPDPPSPKSARHHYRIAGSRPFRSGARRSSGARSDPGREQARTRIECGPCSPEQIRTAVTALRGRRPRPLDDGALLGTAGAAPWVGPFRRGEPTGSGGRTRTPNDRARTCCVADYTTPEGLGQDSQSPPAGPNAVPGPTPRPGRTVPGQPRRARAARRRVSTRSRPSSTIESNSGSPAWRPSTAA